MAKNRQDFVRRAVKVLNAPKGMVAQKIHFLKIKGCTDNEITAALAKAVS